MLIADTFLEWLSEKGEGTWDEFRSTWSWLISKNEAVRESDPARVAGVIAANLSALGYLEMAWQPEARWAIASPTITMLPESGGRALLTGARTRRLCWLPRDRKASPTGLIPEAADELDLWIDYPQLRKAPTSVLIASSQPEDAERLAKQCGISYSYSVSQQLSAMLPDLDLYMRLWEQRPLPQGFPVERFDAATLRWIQSSEEQASRPGLYRSITWHAHVHTLVAATGRPLRASRQHAVFELLRWDAKQVLRYDDASRELWTPVGARLPLLQERAAVLCSGLLPMFRKREKLNGLVYLNVPRVVAKRIASSLSQNLSS
jgi:hypothetical protein